MNDKKSLEKVESFARMITRLAADNGLTVRELHSAADMAKGIVDNSLVEKASIEKSDFPSRHISVTCDGKELFSG